MRKGPQRQGVEMKIAPSLEEAASSVSVQVSLALACTDDQQLLWKRGRGQQRPKPCSDAGV